MTDLTDIFYANSDDFQTIEKMDNVDDVFSNSLNRQKSFTQDAKISNVQTIRDGKKRVVFQDFNEDDPLGDLLSDEDDFKQTEKVDDITSSKSNVLVNLFGIRSKSTLSTPNSDKPTDEIQNVGYLENTEHANTLSKQNFPSDLKDNSSTLLRNNSLLQKHTHNPKTTTGMTESSSDHQPLADNKTKKLLLMEDLFGSKGLSALTETNYDKNTPKPSVDTSTARNIEYSKIQQPLKAQVTGYAPTVSAPREPRRGRRNPTVINDPLGLLSIPSDMERIIPLTNQSVTDSLSTSKVAIKNGQNTELNSNTAAMDDLPEWLGGTKKLQSKKFETIKEISQADNESVNKSEKSNNVQQSDLPYIPDLYQPNLVSVNNVPVNLNLDQVAMLTSAHFDQHATMTVMRQQEHELKTAMCLAQQNDQLNNLLEIQKCKLSDQEKQFSILIKRQTDRQILLEAQMKAQQERIDHYIQQLMAQPTAVYMSPVSTINKNMSDTNELNTDHKMESAKIEHRVQLELTHMENTIQTLKKNHEVEMTMQEESYKKQIFFLQETMDNIENKMQHEIKLLETNYAKKIEELNDEKAHIEKYYKDEIENIKKCHAEFIEEIYKTHSHNIKLLQKEHMETIENISKAKELDSLTTSTILTHKRDIENMLRNIDIMFDNIQTAHNQNVQKDNNIKKIRSDYVKVQEQHLESLRQELEKQISILEKERTTSSDVMQKFDVHVLQLVSELEKRSMQCNEAKEQIHAKEQQLSHERQLFEDKIKWERNYLEALKESWLREQERQLDSLAREKEIIAGNKAKLNVLNKLKLDADNIAKIELETTIKAAQDVIISVNEEKLKWKEKLHELQIQQQLLQEKENHLITRAKEIEMLTQTALAKKEEGYKALTEARNIEDQYKDKLKKLQKQLEAMAQREKKLATEKFTLARERLAFRTSQVEQPEKDTQINTYVNNNTDNSLFLDGRGLAPQIFTHFTDIVDPHLLLLKLDIDNQLHQQ